MTCASVFTSGAGMSRYGPRSVAIMSVNRRVIRSSSGLDSIDGSTSTPPLAPPKGMSTNAVFQVMSDARARISLRSTDGW